MQAVLVAASDVLFGNVMSSFQNPFLDTCKAEHRGGDKEIIKDNIPILLLPGGYPRQVNASRKSGLKSEILISLERLFQQFPEQTASTDLNRI